LYRLAACIPALVLLGMIGTVEAEPAFRFEPATLLTFQQSPGMGTGIAVADFDNDGDADIFLPTGAGHPNLLLRSRGDGSFDEIAAILGLDDTRQARTALWVDYDGDGDLDLFVGRDCRSGSDSCVAPVLSLFEQAQGVFSDVTESVGLMEAVGAFKPEFHSGGLSAADISGDGLPDIYAARWQARPELYISDTLFSSGEAPGYSRGSGLTPITGSELGYWQALMHDFDGNGWVDLFINIDFNPNQLWMNDGALTFNNVAPAVGVDSAWNEMGIAAGDYDNDGDIDIFSSNIFEWNNQGSHNRLWRNDSVGGALAFSERALDEGLGDAAWGWGSVWLDADNDGDLDLAVTNGYCQPDYCGAEHQFDRSRLFENLGPGLGFAEVGEQAGFDDTWIGAGLIATDFDGDGRLDLLQTGTDPSGTGQLTLLFNRPVAGSAEHRLVTIRPRMQGPNTHALGAVVRLVLHNGEVLTRLVQAGESWMSQSPASVHFGVGASVKVERMEIDWPGDDADSVFKDISMNSVMTVHGPETLFKSGFD
jgi:hypothetical protein